MFTGIVEELGTVRSIERQSGVARFTFAATDVLGDARVGDSIAVNGCCLTLVDQGADWWTAEAVDETLRRTCLGGLVVGDRVNLERPVRLMDRLGGHLVQGHVDGVGTLAKRTPVDDGSTVVRFEAAPSLLRYMVEKGSIAVDGVSLTLAGVDDGGFSVALIPHTQAVTTLGIKDLGAPVNLEVDLVAKYVERLVVR